MRLEKLVLSVTAFAVSTVFAGDSLLNFDKTDPTATCILTAESPSPKYVLIVFRVATDVSRRTKRAERFSSVSATIF